MESKKCSGCGAVKSVEEFSWKSKRLGRRESQCKDCGVHNRSLNKEVRAARAAAYHAANRERLNAKKRNKCRIKENARCAAWRKENVAHSRKRAADRKAAKLQRTPSWARSQLIAAYYKEAKRLEELTGIQFHVDHIIPLQGGLVSGLHVENNLQLLPAHENLSKGNKYDPAALAA
jgi:hypothetical protein